MANVFISYKKEDAELAERIVNGLRADGMSVWWDEGLTPAESWDTTIEDQLAAASTVVVLWSLLSTKSPWVRREAHYGQDRGKLIPVIVEPCSVPIAFTLNQTVNLTGWAGEHENKQWRKLLTWITDLVATKPENANIPQAITVVKPKGIRDAVGYLKSGEAVVDGALVNASTPFGTLFSDGIELPVMRILPVGSFLLGADSHDEDRSSYEAPQKRIDIPAPFAMGVYPVLVSEFESIGQFKAGRSPGTTPTQSASPQTEWPVAVPTATELSPHLAIPMTRISFLEASAFAARISAATGESYRLPSEAEWEYACRAGSRTRYSYGDSINQKRAAYGLPKGSVECGKFAPNAFGLYDMHGNVREWTADLWHDSYHLTPIDGRPALEGHGSMRVVRGGGWSDQAATLRSAARMRATESVQSDMIGFRLVRSLL